jgi:hypothetical protein
MWKQRLIALVLGIALTVAATGIFTIAADSQGLPVTPQVYACGAGSGGGGEC